MKIEKGKFNGLLALWIKWDGELWSELRDIQIKLLHERIVKEMTFMEMADKYDIGIGKMREIFRVILNKVELVHGKQLASLLRLINTELEAIETGVKKRGQEKDPLGIVFLN